MTSAYEYEYLVRVGSVSFYYIAYFISTLMVCVKVYSYRYYLSLFKVKLVSVIVCV